MTIPVSIMWFRQDLRVKDNPALNAACDMGKIVPIYIFDESAPDGRMPGGASKWWLHHSLKSLNKRLNGHLQIFKGLSFGTGVTSHGKLTVTKPLKSHF